MIRNVFGKAVTKSTLLSLPEYDREISLEDLATVALALKNSQGKDGDEEPALLRHVQSLRDQCARETETRSTLGWIYNATGGAITLVDSRNWGGRLASSSLYPVRIENGQWGVFLHKQAASVYNSESSGAVLYEGFNCNGSICYWCVTWKNEASSAQVHVWIERGGDWKEYLWKQIHKALEKFDSVHRAKQEGWRSVVSASPGPHVVFEALLTLENL